DASGGAGGESRIDGTGADIDLRDRAGRERAHVDGGPPAGGDALRLPAIGQVDATRERRGERRYGGQRQGEGGRRERGEASGHASVLQRAGMGRGRRVGPGRLARG